MISLQKTGNAIKFTFDNNGHYLYNGTIEVPVNSLTLVTDGSDMFTFKKSATNDIFVSGLYSEIGMTKSELESFYKNNMVDSFINADEAQSMIDESVSGKADYSAATVNINEDVTTTGETYGYLNKSFQPSENVYYFYGKCDFYSDFFRTFKVVLYGQGMTVNITQDTATGETSYYIFEKPDNKTFAVTAKGNLKIDSASFNSDEGRDCIYSYKSKVPVEKAVSTAITDDIFPYLTSLEARVKALEDAQNNS